MSKLHKIKKIKIKYSLIIFALAIIIMISHNFQSTLMRYYSEVTAQVVGEAKKTNTDSYTVVFNNNGGTGSMESISIRFNVPTKLPQNTFINSEYIFKGWNTEADGSGDDYTDEQEVTNLTTENDGVVYLYAKWAPVDETKVAEINGVYYETLQAAVDAVPTTNVKTTIKVLRDIVINASVNISANKNIAFNFQSNTISNASGTNIPFFENNGTIAISNGTLVSSASQGVINNNPGAKLKLSGGSITTTGKSSRQSIYNNGGTLEITHEAYLNSQSTQRATVQNLAGGTTIITGGTIVSTGFSCVQNDSGTVIISGQIYMSSDASQKPTVKNAEGAEIEITGGTIASINNYCIENAGTVTMGEKDENINKTSPTLIGKNCINNEGVFDLYDGVLKAKTTIVTGTITDMETEYSLYRTTEVIDGVTYKTAWPEIIRIVTFDANGGEVSVSEITAKYGDAIGTLPTPTWISHRFDGWFTSAEDGEEVTEKTIITEDKIIYAHWTEVYIAEVNGTQYQTLTAAINDVSANNIETTVRLINDTSEAITIAKGKNIVLDMQGYTLSNNGANRVIVNNGTLKIISGTITSSAAYSAIDNKPGAKLIMTGGSIIATGERQTIYNEGGTVEITGSTYLSSSAPERATVQNLASGTVTITGGRIISITQQAVKNEAIMNIGVKDGTVNTSSPILQGATYGITNTKTFNFYDGILKGVAGTIEGTATNLETNYEIHESTEEIDGITYQTAYLELTQQNNAIDPGQNTQTMSTQSNKAKLKGSQINEINQEKENISEQNENKTTGQDKKDTIKQNEKNILRQTDKTNTEENILKDTDDKINIEEKATTIQDTKQEKDNKTENEINITGQNTLSFNNIDIIKGE